MMGVDMEVERIHENGRYLLQRAYDSGITDPREPGVFTGQMEVESGGFRATAPRPRNRYAHVARWLETFGQREALQRGMAKLAWSMAL